MEVQIHPSWEKILSSEFEANYFKNLTHFVTEAYQKKTCYPPNNLIFEAFNACPLNKLKAVVIGQDPYHGPGEANGLSFSVPHGVTHPPSLVNIFKEIEGDLGFTYPKSGNLFHWANQGVFLLNATLSVEAHLAGSHQNQGWETFTDLVIKNISTVKKNIVFMLWGGFAKQKSKMIDKSRHLILNSGHPSPLSANRGFWFGNKHFSQCNKYLKSKGKLPINWNLKDSLKF